MELVTYVLLRRIFGTVKVLTHHVFAILVWFILLCVVAQAQSIDYVYGIVKGGTGNSSGWYLDQIAINPGTGTYTVSQLVDLSNTGITAGFGGAGHYNQSLNALAVNGASSTVFFTYSYNTTSSMTSGTFFAVSYALRLTTATTGNSVQIFSTNAVGGVTADSGNTPATISCGSGWLPKAAYYNGAYYVGVQDEDSLIKITMGNGDFAASTGNQLYSLINHSTNVNQSAGAGGDIVIDSSGNIYDAGDSYNGGSFTPHVFATETLAHALDGSGTSGAVWNSGTVSSYYQLAGFGQISNLYAAGTSTSLYQVTNYTNPSGTTPTFTALSGTSLPVFTDLSDGSNHSVILPEPGTMVGGIAGCGIVMFGLIRRSWRRFILFPRFRGSPDCMLSPPPPVFPSSEGKANSDQSF